jgi:hypothetical protein
MSVRQERWQDNWTAVSPPGAVRVELQRARAKRRAVTQRVRGLEPGTHVVVSASAPRALARCRTFAAEAGVELEREYLAFPSAAAPAYLVEDAPWSVGVFVKDVLVAPPRSALALPIEAALRLLRVLSPWRLIGAVAPGRVVVGRRT